MYSIGDVVLYGNDVCTVTGANASELASCKGNTIREVDTNMLQPLISYKDMLANFERGILNATG